LLTAFINFGDHWKQALATINKYTIKQALFDGLIEAYMWNILREAFAKAGFPNKPRRDGTIRLICFELIKSDEFLNYQKEAIAKAVAGFIERGDNALTEWIGKTNTRQEDTERRVGDAERRIRNPERRLEGGKSIS
jgi:hypothetical protein